MSILFGFWDDLYLDERAEVSGRLGLGEGDGHAGAVRLGRFAFTLREDRLQESVGVGERGPGHRDAIGDAHLISLLDKASLRLLRCSWLDGRQGWLRPRLVRNMRNY